MSITYKMEVEQEVLDELPGNDLTIMLDYISNTLPSVKEDVFDMKFGSHRVYLEREGINLWTIYRIEKDENTTKVQGPQA